MLTIWYASIMRNRSWTTEQLKHAVKKSKSIRGVIESLGLVPAGGNYEQVKRYIAVYQFDTKHFTGMAWSKGMKGIGIPRIPLSDILVKNSSYQSFKLKKRLFCLGMKKKQCEECGWSKETKDGRIPLELDHINGDRHDNRIENLRVLCPNCHSLKPTHRGLNRQKKA